ncbi:MAG TPA: beta-eliminating lyase-related protein [Bryobacteraceae bacterium]|jgi:threonine aldolase|nr:beta-eliminating lyase-related protein [Bryobacteraceae bacterium]
MNRRAFMQVSAAVPVAAQQFPSALFEPTSVALAYDGVFSSAAEQARLLAKLASEGKVDADRYGRGGAVTVLERQMAALLGKDRAIFLPTGTMANRLALQSLAGERRRVLVSRESHTYNDEGNGPQRLSGLSLVPLAPGRATFTVEDIEAELRRFQGGPPPTPVGAIAMECPVRRQDGRLFDYLAIRRQHRCVVPNTCPYL